MSSESLNHGTSLDEASASVERISKTVKPGAVLMVAAFAAFLATFYETFLNVGFASIMV